MPSARKPQSDRLSIDEDIIAIKPDIEKILNENQSSVSSSHLSLLIEELNQKIGLKDNKILRSINPKLVNEGQRPSIMLQHIDYKLK
jgi:hypothetical protein